MANELTSLLKKIQFQTEMKLDEIGEKIGYSREHISRAKKSPRDATPIINALKVQFGDIVSQNVSRETSSDLSKLIASNQDLAEANKRLSKTHEELVALMKANLTQDPEGQIGAVVLALTDALLKVGEKAEVWDSVDIGRKELNKMVSANLKTKKVVRT
jgi:DNA-binding transcriptional regulator GbsR (MarR family)